MSVYILYLAYGLIKDYGTAENQMLSLAAIVVFIAGGGLILASSAYKLARGDYDDGSAEDETPKAQEAKEGRLIERADEKAADEERTGD